MKKLLKISALIAAMALSCAFFGCSNEDASDGNNSNTGGSTTSSSNNGNGNENSNEEELNLVGTYGISKVENLIKNSKSEQAYTTTMPTNSSLRQYGTQKLIKGKTTTVIETETDVTITKTADGYSFYWAKFNVNGEAQNDDAKTDIEAKFTDDYWNSQTEMFAMTLTTTADGKWSINSSPALSGTYTVDEANSKVTLKTLIRGEETLAEPEIMEATYSDNGKTLVVVQDDSDEYGTDKYIMTFTRK